MEKETTNIPDISILLPTRGRTDQLDRSISSLIDLAKNPKSIEWLFGFDKDDQDSYQYFQQKILPKIEATGGTYTVMQFEPLGYVKLNQYVNTLALNSKGRWMVFWNDDAIMETQDWDATIAAQGDRFCLQAFDTHRQHPYSIFPIVPRKWLEIIGHLSLHHLNDAWLSQIAWMLDIMVRIPVKVEHERFDLTGKNNDETFKNRMMFESNPNDPRDFNHLTYRNARLKEVWKLHEYLKKEGYDVSHWEMASSGKIDVWDKMLASDINGQMTRLK